MWERRASLQHGYELTYIILIFCTPVQMRTGTDSLAVSRDCSHPGSFQPVLRPLSGPFTFRISVGCHSFVLALAVDSCCLLQGVDKLIRLDLHTCSGDKFIGYMGTYIHSERYLKLRLSRVTDSTPEVIDTFRLDPNRRSFINHFAASSSKLI